MATHKFIVSSSALLRAVKEVNPAITSNPVVPILDNLLFDIKSSKLTITASDLETSITTSLAVEAKTECSITVPARVLLDTLKSLPDQPITFTLNEEENTAVLATSNGRYKLACQSATDFPRVPVVKGSEPLEIPSSALARALSKTLFAVSYDELRPAMTGILVQVYPTQLTFVATDGHRLIRYQRTDITSSRNANVIIPRKACGLLKGALGTEETVVKVEFNSTNAIFSFHQIRLVCRLVDERYPDYENVIPVSNPNTLQLNRLDLLNTVRRLNIYSNRTTHQIRLRLTASELTVSAEDLDFNREASEKLACQYDGEEFEIGFNARFFQEVLSSLDSIQVSLALSTPNRAGLFSPVAGEDEENVLMLVMPVMLNNYV
ncbi:DNA polymerase III subunit beta [Hymenobacter sp. HD11105]